MAPTKEKMMETKTPEALVSAYSAATGAYTTWLNTPEWRRRKRVRLRATAERLAREADERRAAVGVKSNAMPLIDLLDMQTADDQQAEAAAPPPAPNPTVQITPWGYMTLWLEEHRGSMTMERHDDRPEYFCQLVDADGETKGEGTAASPSEALTSALAEAKAR